MKKNSFAYVVGITLLGLAALAQRPASPSKSVELTDLLRGNCYPIVLKDGVLSGPGNDFLLRETKDVQFVAIGEQHNSAQIPEFTTALLRELHASSGFNHLALEQDPVAAHMASQPGYAGSRTAIKGLARRYPSAFTFDGDQELEMIADVGAIAQNGTDAVWGLDQVFGVEHVLQQLLPYAPNAKAGESTKYLIEAAHAVESQRGEPFRHYIYVDNTKPPDFDRLNEMYQPKPGSYPAFLLEQLYRSVSIYRDNDLASKGQFTGYKSNAEREENMKFLFMRNYRLAQQRGEHLPRVVLKMGNIHLFRGRNILNVVSMGDFASEFATSNGLSSLHFVAYINNDKPGDYSILRDDPKIGALFQNAPSNGWTIYDLRPLRGSAYAGKLSGLTPELKNLIFGYDLALLIGGGSHATHTVVPR